MADGDQGVTSTVKEIRDGLLGLATFAIIGWFAWGYFFGSSEQPPAQDPNMTLVQFKSLTPAQRTAYVTASIAKLPGAKGDDAAFQRCMSDYAARKSDTLLFTEVLGWCEHQRETNRQVFEDHFDELAWGDLSTTARRICDDEVKLQLVAPATADFALLDARIFHHDRQDYEVSSYVDSQNSFGAKIRTRFTCRVRFTGHGRPSNPASWTTPEVAFQP